MARYSQRPAMMPRTMFRWLLLAAINLAFALPATRAARIHTVKSGETLTSIAAEYNVTVGQLARANQLRDRDLLRRGQKLQIPAPTSGFIQHKVARGESIASIAKKYRVSVANIRAHNKLADPNLIVPGQMLNIPLGTGTPPPPTADQIVAARESAPDPRRTLPESVQSAIDDARVKKGRWKHIVIHHSATNEATAKGMDDFHRKQQRMENGLAYHFLIGNGRGMKDGEIYVSRRWTNQLDGGHLAIPELNANSIGICLVGNFESATPTTKQLNTLEALIRALQDKTQVSDKAVTTHRLIHKKHTKCPGKNFPLATLQKRLKEP